MRTDRWSYLRYVAIVILIVGYYIITQVQIDDNKKAISIMNDILILHQINIESLNGWSDTWQKNMEDLNKLQSSTETEL